MFNDDVYVELMNEKIKLDDHYVNGMRVENIGSGIVLTMNGRDISVEEPQILQLAHIQIVKDTDEIMSSLKIKIKH